MSFEVHVMYVMTHSLLSSSISGAVFSLVRLIHIRLSVINEPSIHSFVKTKSQMTFDLIKIRLKCVCTHTQYFLLNCRIMLFCCHAITLNPIHIIHIISHVERHRLQKWLSRYYVLCYILSSIIVKTDDPLELQIRRGSADLS